MKNRLKALTFLLMLLSFIPAESTPILTSTPPKQPSWIQLRPVQQKILAPLSQDWDQFPDSRRKQLLASVNRYPKMTSVQQQRFSRRILKWSQLSKEQRGVARERFKQFQRLTPDQRTQIKRRWAEQHPTKTAQPDQPIPTPATDSSSTMGH